MATNNDERLCISVREAAKALGISRNLAYDLARTGQLPGAIRLGKKRIIISKTQFWRWVDGSVKTEDKDGEQ